MRISAAILGALLVILLFCAGAAVPAGSGTAPQLFEPRVVVYISGAVRKPGVYKLPPGTRVADAIQAAGGPVRGAALGDLELASALQDGDSVRVPTATPRPAMTGGAPIVSLPSSFDRRAAAHRPRVTRRPPSGGRKVDLNHAGAADLQRLPGVGPGLAARIIAYRRRAGRFQRVEELREVQGIGEKRLARMAPCIELR